MGLKCVGADCIPDLTQSSTRWRFSNPCRRKYGCLALKGSTDFHVCWKMVDSPPSTAVRARSKGELRGKPSRGLWISRLDRGPTERASFEQTWQAGEQEVIMLIVRGKKIYSAEGNLLKIINCPANISPQNLERKSLMKLECKVCNKNVIDTDYISEPEIVIQIKSNSEICLRIDRLNPSFRFEK
jgi:hypothetical protein